MLNRFNAAMAAIMALASNQAAAAASPADVACWRSDEVHAARIDRMQVALMVDAIKCRDTIPATFASFDDFNAKRHDLLIASKFTVQAHFVRLLGPDLGIKASTDYDTVETNRLSAAAIDVKRCETSGLYARLAASAGEDDLMAMAAMIAGDDGMSECPTAAAVAPRPTAMVIHVWPKPAPVAAVAPVVAPAVAVVPMAVAPAPVIAAATPVAPVAIPAVAVTAAAAPAVAVTPAVVATPVMPMAPAPIRVAAAVPAYGPAHVAALEQQRNDTLKALQAAAAALTQATAALLPAQN